MEFIIGYRKKAQRSWRFTLGWVALVYAVIGGGVVLSLGYLGWSANQRWQDYTDALQVAGEPLTFGEIEALRPTIPECRNGARVIDRLGPQLGAIEDARMDAVNWHFATAGTKWATKYRCIDFFRGIPRSTIARTRDFTQEHGETLVELSSLHAVKSGRFDLVFQNDPSKLEFPHHGWLRGARWLVLLDGVSSLVDGDLERAGEAVKLEFKLANMIRNEPTLLSHIVGMGIDKTALELLQNTLRVGEMSPELVNHLYNVVADRASSSTMKWALWGERAFYVELLEWGASGHSLSSPTAIESGELESFSISSWLKLARVRDYQIRGAQHISSMMTVADDPHALLDAVRTYETNILSDSELGPLAEIMPPLERAIALHACYCGYLRSAQAALAAERFRLSTGRLPTAPDELVPDFLNEWPTDPFDGQPMRFATTCEGVVIYSIHYDFHDDGGSVTPIDGEQRPRDWGFRLFHAEERGLLIIEDMPEAAEQQAKN